MKERFHKVACRISLFSRLISVLVTVFQIPSLGFCQTTVSLPISINEGNGSSWTNLQANATKGYNIQDASIDGKFDAFNGFGGVRIDNQVIFGGVTSAQRQYFADGSALGSSPRVTFAPFTATGGLIATQSFYFYTERVNNAAVVRILLTLNNPTGQDLTRRVSFFGELGSALDEQSIRGGFDTDVSISADQAVTSGVEPVDPPIAFVGHRGVEKMLPNRLYRSTFGVNPLEFEVRFSDVRLPANTTSSLVLFVAIAESISVAESAANSISRLNGEILSDMFFDLSASEKAQIINFDTTPSDIPACSDPSVLGSASNPCAVALGDCFMSVGKIDGPSAANTIEQITEFPRATETTCQNLDDTVPQGSHLTSSRHDVGRMGGFLYNGNGHNAPEFPGYLSTSRPVFPSGFPVPQSAHALVAKLLPGPIGLPEPNVSVSRYGSESIQIRFIDGSAESLNMTLAGGGERVHVRHNLTPPAVTAPIVDGTVALQLYNAGGGEGNGFYLDHFGIRNGPGTFGFTGPEAGENVPISVFLVGKKDFAASPVVAAEFSAQGHASEFRYNASFDSDSEEATPGLPGVLSDASVEGVGSARTLNIDFTLNAPVLEGWLAVQSFGTEPMSISIDGVKVDAVAATSQPELTQFMSYLKALNAGDHTITLEGAGVRYIDYIELEDRSAESSKLGAAPKAPVVKQALFKKNKLTAKIIANSNSSERCTMRVFGGSNPLMANKLLAYLTPRFKQVSVSLTIPKKGRSKKYYLRAVKSCSGLKNAVSAAKRVRVRR
jgi:hypothetical protein